MPGISREILQKINFTFQTEKNFPQKKQKIYPGLNPTYTLEEVQKMISQKSEDLSL